MTAAATTVRKRVQAQGNGAARRNHNQRRSNKPAVLCLIDSTASIGAQVALFGRLSSPATRTAVLAAAVPRHTPVLTYLHPRRARLLLLLLQRPRQLLRHGRRSCDICRLRSSRSCARTQRAVAVHRAAAGCPPLFCQGVLCWAGSCVTCRAAQQQRSCAPVARAQQQLPLLQPCHGRQSAGQTAAAGGCHHQQCSHRRDCHRRRWRSHARQQQPLPGLPLALTLLRRPCATTGAQKKRTTPKVTPSAVATSVTTRCC